MMALLERLRAEGWRAGEPVPGWTGGRTASRPTQATSSPDARAADLVARSPAMRRPQATSPAHPAPHRQGLAGLPKPTDPPSRQRPWISLGLSAALHAAILALAVHLTREPVAAAGGGHRHRRRKPRARCRWSTCPRHRPRSRRRRRRHRRRHRHRPRRPRRRSHRRSDRPRRRRKSSARPSPTPTRRRRPTARGGAGAGQRRPGRRRAHRRERSQGGLTRAGHRDAAATMESEARRIFGRPRLGTQPGAGPRASRPMEAYLPDRPGALHPEAGPAARLGRPRRSTAW